MQSEFSVKCSAGKLGSRGCSLLICKEISVLCSDKECQCQIKHKLCATTSIEQIWRSLKLKGQSHKPILLMFLEWYDIQIKRFQVEREQLQNSIDKNEPVLFDHEKQLYHHLKTGDSEKIKSQLVLKTIESLHQAKQFEYKTTLLKMRIFLHTKTKEINEIIEKTKEFQIRCINKYQEIEPNSTFRFSQTLHHQNYEVVNDKTIKLKQQPNKWVIALIQPNISTERELRLQAVELQDKHLFFGVCQIEDMNKINQINHDTYEKGVLMFFHSPKNNYFGETKGTVRTKDQIRVIDKQDIVSVKCLLDTSTVVFRNESKGTTTEFKIEIDKNLPLYFCVILHYQGNSVKILN